MSTPCNVYLELKKKDINTIRRTNLDYLNRMGTKVLVHTNILEENGTPVKNDEELNELFPRIQLDKQVVGITIIFDGYPLGVGYTLFKHFANYDKILNLILLGDCESISRFRIFPYFPVADVRIKMFDYADPHNWCSSFYAYLFKNDKWLARGPETEWKDLKYVLLGNDI